MKEEKKFKLGLSVIIGVLVLAFLVVAVYVYQKGQPREADLFLIPQGYTGMVVVQYGIADAPEMPREGEYWVNKIGADGKLNSPLERPERVFPRGTDQFYFVDAQGNRTEAVKGVHVHGGEVVYEGSDDAGKGRFYVGTAEEWAKVLRQLNEEAEKKKKAVRTGM